MAPDSGAAINTTDTIGVIDEHEVKLRISYEKVQTGAGFIGVGFSDLV
jgi:hypothetical protein